MRDRPHDEVMIENYRSDPAFAASLLNDVLHDGDADEIRHYLKQMNAAFGDGANQPKGIDGLLATMRAMGLRLSVAPEPTPRKRPAKSVATKRAGRARHPVAEPVL